MEYAKFGNTDMIVSRLCLGCMGFGDAGSGQHGWTVGQAQTKEMIGAAIDKGINFFDTAAAYQNGTCEEFVGSALKALSKRKDVVLATKFVPRTGEQRQTVTGKQHILNSLDASLKRLDTDYVDLYIYHMWDYFTPVEEIMDGLNEAVKSGRTRYIGISNCFAWQLQKANDVAERNGWAKFVSVQNHYNLLFREEEREMFACAADGNIAMTPYSPLASGRLVKAADETSKRLETDAYAKKKYDKTAEQDKIIIDRVALLAEKKGLTRIQIAIAWLLEKVTAPIFGATKLSHIEGATSAIGIKLTDEEIAYLEEEYVPHQLVGVMADNTGKSVYALPKRENLYVKTKS